MAHKEIYEIAEELGIQYVETTTGSNGYPEKLKYALTGFSSIEELREVEKEYDLQAVQLEKRDGHDLWNRSKAVYAEPFDMAAVYDDDPNARMYRDEEDLKDVVRNLGVEIADGGLTIEEIKDKVNFLGKIEDKLDIIDDTQFLLVDFANENIDVVDCEAMEYHYDVTSYALGLIEK